MARESELKSILNQFYEHKLAHAYLIETNNEEKALQDITDIIKNINCPNKYKENCEKCSICNTIASNNYPENIVIDLNGQIIKKEIVLDIRQRLSSKPVFGKYKTFVIASSDRLNNYSANVLLKILEEPGADIVGFLVTKQKEMIIPTIKSRCQTICANYETNETEIISKFSEIYKSHKSLINSSQLLNYSEIIEGNLEGRPEVEKYFTYIFNLLLVENERKLSEINKKKLGITKTTIQMVKSNVNIDMCFDYFTIEMRSLNG